MKKSRSRIQKLNAIPKWLTAEHKAQIASIYAQAKQLEMETGVPHQVDHIIPLQGDNVCGLHVPWNLRAITAKENRRKWNRLEEDACG